MANKLIVTAAPHITSADSTQKIMQRVCLALVPALIASVITFGINALILTAVTVIACVAFEYGYCKLMGREIPVGDFSAVVTGMLLALTCTANLPWWLLVIGAFFAIVVVKQLYGGIGCNFLNPALGGRAILVASYAGLMGNYSLPKAKLDVVLSTATPMQIMKEGTVEQWEILTSNYSVGDMFLGNIGGAMGEVSALALLLGGAYLIIRKVISWHIPVAYIGTVLVLSLVAAPAGIDAVQYMLYSVFGGGLMLGAIFMATDYATSPVTKPGQLIYGIGCGLLTVFIRRFGSFPEGVCYSILIMNCTTWLLDKYIRPTIYGAVKKEKKEAAK